jgi:imidazolonepropionase-like amidohydrolase
MTRSLRVALRGALPLVLPAVVAQAQATPAPRALVLVRANLIDGTGAAPQRDVTIVVEGGRIARIGAGAQPVSGPADTIDVAGRWVPSGMIDAHTHIASTAAMRKALESGVTTVRSASTPHYEDVGLRALVRRGVLVGPEMLAAGVFVTPYLGETALADPRLAEYAGAVLAPAQLRGVVRVNLDRGVDVVKTRATERAGLPDQDPRKQVYDAAQLRAVVEEAATRNVPVLVHAHGDEGAYAAVQAGARSIEHGTFLSDSTLALMKARGAFLVPTYTTVVDLTRPGGDYDDPVLTVRGEAMLPRLADVIRRAVRLGVPVVTGVDTDYGPKSTSRVAHEAAAFVQVGAMTPMQALRAATAEAARMLGLDARTGTVTAGKEADLIVVERNPLDDIGALADVLVVIADGRIGLRRIPFALR